MKIFFLKLVRVIFLAPGFNSLNRVLKHVTSEFFRILLLLVLALAPAWGWAQNLVVDPFFSNPSASWIYSAPNFTTPGAAIRGTTPTAVTTAGGTKAFESGCVGAACLTFPVVPGTSSSASQAVPTTIGEGYVLIFWMFGTGQALTETDAYWGNTRVSAAAPTVAGWTQVSVNLGAATSSSTTLTFLIRNDPSYSQVTFAQVYAYPKLTVTKTAPAIATAAQTITYSVQVANSSASVTATSVTLSDLISSGATLGSITCIASGTAVCPSPLTLPTTSAVNLPSASTLSFSITALVSAPAGSSVTNTASVSSTRVSTLTSVLSATVVTPVKALANLSISKTNGVSSVTAGRTTTYTISAVNSGPAAAAGAVVLDRPSAGMSCTTLVCAASVGALCPASLNVNTFTSTGLSLPSFGPNSTVTFALTCGVLATGQ